MPCASRTPTQTEGCRKAAPGPNSPFPPAATSTASIPRTYMASLLASTSPRLPRARTAGAPAIFMPEVPFSSLVPMQTKYQYDFTVADTVKVPEKEGRYVLSWRWDAEQTPQVWSNCALVDIVQESKNRPSRALRGAARN